MPPKYLLPTFDMEPLDEEHTRSMLAQLQTACKILQGDNQLVRQIFIIVCDNDLNITCHFSH